MVQTQGFAATIAKRLPVGSVVRTYGYEVFMQGFLAVSVCTSLWETEKEQGPLLPAYGLVFKPL